MDFAEVFDKGVEVGDNIIKIGDVYTWLLWRKANLSVSRGTAKRDRN